MASSDQNLGTTQVLPQVPGATSGAPRPPAKRPRPPRDRTWLWVALAAVTTAVVGMGIGWWMLSAQGGSESASAMGKTPNASKDDAGGFSDTATGTPDAGGSAAATAPVAVQPTPVAKTPPHPIGTTNTAPRVVPKVTFPAKNPWWVYPKQPTVQITWDPVTSMSGVSYVVDVTLGTAASKRNKVPAGNVVAGISGGTQVYYDLAMPLSVSKATFRVIAIDSAGKESDPSASYTMQRGSTIVEVNNKNNGG